MFRKYFKKFKEKLKEETDIANGINLLPADLKDKLDNYSEFNSGRKLGQSFTFDEFLTIFSLSTLVFNASYRDEYNIEFYHDDAEYTVIVCGKAYESVSTSDNPNELLNNIAIDGHSLKSVWDELQ